ncbi:hypothetical protein FF1_046790 [Malus domestica]
MKEKREMAVAIATALRAPIKLRVLGRLVACGGLIGRGDDDLFDDGLGNDGDVVAGGGLLDSLECFDLVAAAAMGW